MAVFKKTEKKHFFSQTCLNTHSAYYNRVMNRIMSINQNEAFHLHFYITCFTEQCPGEEDFLCPCFGRLHQLSRRAEAVSLSIKLHAAVKGIHLLSHLTSVSELSLPGVGSSGNYCNQRAGAHPSDRPSAASPSRGPCGPGPEGGKARPCLCSVF